MKLEENWFSGNGQCLFLRFSNLLKFEDELESKFVPIRH
jgi:hypothetical protein